MMKKMSKILVAIGVIAAACGITIIATKKYLNKEYEDIPVDNLIEEDPSCNNAKE